MLDVKKLLTKVLEWMGEKSYTGYGTNVDISAYTSSNKYTVPSDGIVSVTCTYRSNSYIQLYRGDGTVLLQQSTTGSANMAGNLVATFPVYKGMQVYVTRSSTYSSALFTPYTT